MAKQELTKIEVRQALPTEMEQVFDLRWRVLLEPFDLPRRLDRDEYDERPNTIHGAAFSNDQLVATGRINIRDENFKELQVRYMATEEAYRGQELGAQVLSLMEELALPLEAESILLSARYRAQNLYARAGYRVVSPEFEAVGMPHVMMQKVLNG